LGQIPKRQSTEVSEQDAETGTGYPGVSSRTTKDVLTGEAVVRVYARVNKRKTGHYLVGNSLEKPDQVWVRKYTGIAWRDVALIRASKYKNNPCWLIELKAGKVD